MRNDPLTEAEAATFTVTLHNLCVVVGLHLADNADCANRIAADLEHSMTRFTLRRRGNRSGTLTNGDMRAILAYAVDLIADVILDAEDEARKKTS